MFKSFFQAGFEAATGYNRHRQWIDQIAATQHDLQIDDDYRRLRDAGLLTAREAVRWPLVDHGPRHYDFSSLSPFFAAADRYGIELIYDLFHYGYPERIDLFSEAFPRQFADYCFAAADYITRQMPGTYWFTPINEPSFFSWAAGEVGLFSPHAIGRGWELKVQLIKAAIRGIEAIRAACSGARIVNVDPLCHIAVPREKPELQREIDGYNQGVVFQGWDLLGGKLMPELGGSPEHLGIVGVNYYWTNQWEWGHSGQPLAADDERRWPLNRLIQQVWSRYGAEMLITETSHLGELRPIWLRELTNEVKTVLNTGLPLHGVCLYPILGMPEWHAPEEWTQMGLWELRPNGDRLERVPHSPMMEALREAQQSEEIRRLSLRPA